MLLDLSFNELFRIIFIKSLGIILTDFTEEIGLIYYDLLLSN